MICSWLMRYEKHFAGKFLETYLFESLKSSIRKSPFLLLDVNKGVDLVAARSHSMTNRML